MQATNISPFQIFTINLHGMLCRKALARYVSLVFQIAKNFSWLTDIARSIRLCISSFIMPHLASAL